MSRFEKNTEVRYTGANGTTVEAIHNSDFGTLTIRDIPGYGEDSVIISDIDMSLLREVLNDILGNTTDAQGITFIESSPDAGTYYRVNTKMLTCTCPDHRFRGTYCKHLAMARSGKEA
jgi:hypothetical protein